MLLCDIALYCITYEFIMRPTSANLEHWTTKSSTHISNYLNIYALQIRPH